MKASIKEQELRSVIGTNVSFNGSPTLRAKLLKVNKKTCIMEVVPSVYKNPDMGTEDIGNILKVPLEHTWNAYFY